MIITHDDSFHDNRPIKGVLMIKLTRVDALKDNIRLLNINLNRCICTGEDIKHWYNVTNNKFTKGSDLVQLLGGIYCLIPRWEYILIDLKHLYNQLETRCSYYFTDNVSQQTLDDINTNDSFYLGEVENLILQIITNQNVLLAYFKSIKNYMTNFVDRVKYSYGDDYFNFIDLLPPDIVNVKTLLFEVGNDSDYEVSEEYYKLIQDWTLNCMPRTKPFRMKD